MAYRTKTYLAGDWTGDADLIKMLQDRNKSDYWNLDFIDAHDMTQSNDTSKYCSIKKSLGERMDASKTFVLIVGKDTSSLTKGSCRYCGSYSSYSGCLSGNTTSMKSFIEYECDKAIRDGLKIVVIYNYSFVWKEKCPDVVKNIGKHIKGYYFDSNDHKQWNYSEIKETINN